MPAEADTPISFGRLIIEFDETSQKQRVTCGKVTDMTAMFSVLDFWLAKQRACDC